MQDQKCTESKSSLRKWTYTLSHKLQQLAGPWHATLQDLVGTAIPSTVAVLALHKHPYGLETVPSFAGSHVKFIGKRSALSCVLPK